MGDLVEDPDRFRAAVENGVGRARILKNIRLAGASGVAGVPAVFIGAARYFGELDAQELASALDNPAARRWEPRIPRQGAHDR